MTEFKNFEGGLKNCTIFKGSVIYFSFSSKPTYLAIGASGKLVKIFLKIYEGFEQDISCKKKLLVIRISHLEKQFNCF